MVKLDIDSPWLSDLNERVSKLPNEDKYRVYHPHCTVAYTKKGVAAKLAGVDPFAAKEVKPQFTAAEMEFKGACEQDDDPNRVVEVIRFSTQKEPQVKEALDPDAVDPKEYVRKTPLEYAVRVLRPNGADSGLYLSQQGVAGFKPCWMMPRSLDILKHAQYFDPHLKVRILTRSRLKEALDPDAIDPKQALKKAVRWPCAKCGRDLGAPESVIREYFSRHGHDPVHSLGHYDVEGSFEPDTSVTLTAELHGYDLADDSDSCSACGASTMEKIQEAVDPDAVDPKHYTRFTAEQIHHELVSLAVEAAELVLPIFEREYPKDGRPRKAIEAAKAWLKNPSDKTADAAAHAAHAAYNAADAADAAYAAYAAHAPELKAKIEEIKKTIEWLSQITPEPVKEALEESRTPDPFGHLDFPTDASQTISYLRKKRKRRPVVL